MTSVDNSIPVASPTAAAAPTAAPAGDGGFSFGDLLDIVNPLQHLPVVGTLYRAITGDSIKTFPKAAGDLLYGGPIGFVSSLADTVFQNITGKDFGSTVLAKVEDMFSPSDSSPAAPIAVAANTPSGESFGDRLIADIGSLFSSSDTPTAVASNAPAAPATPAAVTPASLDSIVVPGRDALLTALSRNGIGSDTAGRAADAYRRSLGVLPPKTTLPMPGLRTAVAD